ncbi:MAG TPA: GtrA family protein [Caulobacteraceae bacterium]|jgi:putative flippase GtrA|nr:GtrA family protein [Caulobacteraceae bacterium]
MSISRVTAHEAGLAIKFAAVGLAGFTVDAIFLKAGLALHLGAAWARLISLTLAMQVTFTVNRIHVFHCWGRPGLLRQWCAYMATNGFGNFCNYWIFVTLSSLHGRLVSEPFVALPISALAAYLINYAGARLVVFGRKRLRRRAPARAFPHPPAPERESLL